MSAADQYFSSSPCLDCGEASVPASYSSKGIHRCRPCHNAYQRGIRRKSRQLDTALADYGNNLAACRLIRAVYDAGGFIAPDGSTRGLDPDVKLEIFKSNARQTDRGCLEFPSLRGRSGYGVIYVNGKTVSIHRLTWQETRGPIPRGMFICHHCDNPPCFNLEHLYLGTVSENTRDAFSRGRIAVPRGESVKSSRLTEDQVRAARVDHANGIPAPRIAAKYGVSNAAIHKIILGETWSWLT